MAAAAMQYDLVRVVLEWWKPLPGLAPRLTRPASSAAV